MAIDDVSQPGESIDERRLLAVSRFQSAKIFEEMGCTPWQSISNSHHKSCDRPCVSVIIPLYNYSRYIQQCLESVTKSDFENIAANIEILVIDDRSTDNSAEVVEEYLERSPASIYLVKKHLNTGLADVRNIGLKLARAPYVFMLDADNWIEPNCLSVLYRQIKSSDLASVYGKIRTFNNETQEYYFNGLFEKEWDVAELIRDPYIDAMAMFDKKILLDLGGYSTELVEYGWFGWEDYDLWLKLAEKNYDCKLVPEILSSYRIHSSSMINTTHKFKINMSRYFNCKFANLAQRLTSSDKLFGSERRHVEGIDHQKLKLDLDFVKYSTMSQELNQCYITIEKMRGSKFWKLRHQWLTFKAKLGLPVDI
jgi:glycosyltransferase involved in cell wall biosynthesis